MTPKWFGLTDLSRVRELIGSLSQIANLPVSIVKDDGNKLTLHVGPLFCEKLNVNDVSFHENQALALQFELPAFLKELYIKFRSYLNRN
jgi:hypothetical protein